MEASEQTAMLSKVLAVKAVSLAIDGAKEDGVTEYTLRVIKTPAKGKEGANIGIVVSKRGSRT